MLTFGIEALTVLFEGCMTSSYFDADSVRLLIGFVAVAGGLAKTTDV